MLKNAFIIGGASKGVGQIKPWFNVKKHVGSLYSAGFDKVMEQKLKGEEWVLVNKTKDSDDVQILETKWRK